MREWLAKWLMRKEIARAEKLAYSTTVSPDETPYKPQPKIRIGMVEAINGKCLEVSTYKANPHGPDWKSEYYIIDPAQPLAEQIATVLVMKGLSV